MGRRIVVIGTGTGVGKTHVSVALALALTSCGVSVAGMKPVESGVGVGPTDATALDEAGTFHVKHPPPFALAAPISPHLAAEREGTVIQLQPILAWVGLSDAEVTIVETAGALLSPISRTLTNLDLTVALNPDAVLLVAPDRLGVLHDVTATLFAYHMLAHSLPEPIVALQPPADPDDSTSLNAEELLRLGVARTTITFPRADRAAALTLERAKTLAQLLGAL